MAAKLTGRQESAVAALLTEPTIEAAALKAQIGARTLYRWLHAPLFAAAYREARRQAVGQATARLQQASADAVTTLQSVMTDPTAPAPARVNAAKAVLEIAVKAIEVEDLEARVEELEQALTVFPRNGRAPYAVTPET